MTQPPRRRPALLDRLEARRLLAAATGRVFIDADASGFEDFPENNAGAGFSVFADLNANGSFDAGEPSDATSGNGGWELSGLPAGPTHFGVVPRGGFAVTGPNRGGRERGQFDIAIDYPTGSGFDDPRYRFAFDQAARFWESVIVGDLPDYEFQGFLNNGENPAEDVFVFGFPQVPDGLVDDLLITATRGVIDGEQGTLARAGPSVLRGAQGTGLPIYGTMEFDVFDYPDDADEAGLAEFYEVAVHEMGHVLGIGTLWETRTLLDGKFGAGARFIGANALDVFRTQFNQPDATGIPVEADFSQGTRLGHWDESFFNEEGMTGLVEGDGSDLPFSRMTVASLEDLGYNTNVNSAQYYRYLLEDPADEGLVPYEWLAELDETDNDGFTRNLDFGVRTNASPRIGKLVVPDRTPAEGEQLNARVTRLTDADNDLIVKARFYLETNGVDGLQVGGGGGDNYLAQDVDAKNGFSVEADLAGIPAGRYVLYARINDVFDATATRQTSVRILPAATVPAAPSAVRAFATGGSTARVTFDDNSADEDGFVVQYSPNADFRGAATVAVGKNRTTAFLGGLDENRTYYVRARAQNENGNSAYAARAAFDTVNDGDVQADDSVAALTGNWQRVAGTSSIGGSYLQLPDGRRGTARFDLNVRQDGEHYVYASLPTSDDDLARNLVLNVAGEPVVIDQTRRGGGLILLGKFDFEVGDPLNNAVTVDGGPASLGDIQLDAIRLIPVDGGATPQARRTASAPTTPRVATGVFGDDEDATTF